MPNILITISHVAENFDVVQQEVSDLLEGKFLIGHAVHNDLKVIYRFSCMDNGGVGESVPLRLFGNSLETSLTGKNAFTNLYVGSPFDTPIDRKI